MVLFVLSITVRESSKAESHMSQTSHGSRQVLAQESWMETMVSVTGQQQKLLRKLLRWQKRTELLLQVWLMYLIQEQSDIIQRCVQKKDLQLSHSASQIRWQYHTAEQSLIMEQTRFHLLARQQTIVMLYLIWLQQFRLGEKSWTRDHRVLRFLQTGLQMRTELL